jgi:hypothetical protein
MLRFKQFENLFTPKNMDDRESVRMQLLEQEVEKEVGRYVRLKTKLSPTNLLDAVVEDIFFIWDKYNSDDREGIEHFRSGFEHTFHFTNDKFLEHVELFLNKIGCKYRIPDIGSLILEKFTS